MTDKTEVAFLGFLAGLFLAGILVEFSRPDVELKSYKKIKPTMQITLDGKTIDTLYIYKQ